MRTFWNILKRLLIAIAVVVYVVVALVNMSVVQSYLGTYAGRYFSREWGAEVKIGSLHATPLNHVILDHVLLVAPDGDTIANAERIMARFRRFPLSGEGLSFDRVLVRNTYYHLECHNKLTNLEFIISYYNPNHTTTPPTGKHFIVRVRQLDLDNVHYKMDLDKAPNYVIPDSGVVIPHMEFFGISGRIRNIKVDNDYIDCRVMRLKAREKSGFEMTDMHADVKVSPYIISARNLDVSTTGSRIVCDAEMTYDTWLAMSEDGYCYNVNHDAVLKEGTSVSMADVAYWAPVLWGMDGQVSATGHYYGTINDLHAENAHIEFGNDSEVELDGAITGLPDADNMGLDVRVERLLTNYDDVQSLGLGRSTLKIDMPHILAKLGNIDATANLEGTMKRCNATLNCRTGLGRIDLAAALTQNNNTGTYAYAADLSSDGFGIAAVVPNEWLALTGIDITVNGEGFDPMTMTASVDGRLYNTVLRGNHLAATTFKADIADRVLTADVALADTLAKLTLSGSADWTDSVAAVNVDLAIDKAHLSKLGLVTADSLVVTTQLQAEVHGNDFEHSNAVLSLDNTVLEEPGKILALRNATVRLSDKNGRKSISVGSDVARASLDGYFSYANIPLIVNNVCNRFVPRRFNPFDINDNNELDLTPIAADVFNFSVVLDDEEGRLRSFFPSVFIAPQTTVTGNYNFAEALKLVVRSESITMGSVSLNSVIGDGHVVGGRYTFNLKADELVAGVRPLLQKLNFVATSDTSDMTAMISWDDDIATTFNEGRLSFRLDGDRIAVEDHTFYVHGARWDVTCSEGVLVADSALAVDRLNVTSLGHGLSLSASVRKQYNDFVEARFDKLALSRLSDVLLQNSPLSVAGELNGRFSLYGLADKPYFNAKLKVDSCGLNGYHLGEVDIQSSWNSELNQLGLYLTADPLAANGYIALGMEHPELDFAVDFNSLNLSMVEPLLASVATRFGGVLEGELHVGGTLEAPVVEGTAAVENGMMQLAMTDVTYTFDDSITFSGNTVSLNEFTMHDPSGNAATLDGTIVYNSPEHIDVNLDLHTGNFMVLNNRPRGDEFYGTVYVAAGGKVYGDLNNLNVDLDVRTNSGSTLTVPINDRRQVQSQNYIVFVADTPEPVHTAHSEAANSAGGLNLQVNLAITPDLALVLPMDFSEATARINATGQGDVLFTLGPDGTPDVLGSYTFNSGTMKLRLLQLFEKGFTIDNGSSLNFQGDVMSTTFDISAVYSQRVNLSTLTGTSAVESSQKNIQVEDVINISGTLQAPEVSFDIRLPNADQSVQEEVFSYIDRNSERDMLNQAMSLLLFGHFANNSTSSAATVGESTSIGGTSMVASSLGSVISDMVQFVDVNFDYKGATSFTPEQMEVDISKEWKNVYFTSTFGYGGEMSELSGVEGGTLVGDMLVGWKVTPALHLFVYNRSNTNDYTRVDMPYKQGAGLKLTKDFDRWSDLFKRNKR
ncbi:MAG: translocation/assembly module TamB [Bacteroidales bacterium]|nr:translocation/assembly module TamB [Bacteroidales bacterium]